MQDDNRAVIDTNSREERTERITLTPSRFHRDELLAIAHQAAQLHSVRIDSIEEKRGLVTVEIRMTVIGDPDGIVALSEATSGIREREPLKGKVRRWFDAVMGGIAAGGGPWG